VSEFLIIGPSNAGKTALLATVDHAAMDPETLHDGLEVRVYKKNAPMSRLSEMTLQTVREGRLPVVATNALEKFSFTFEVKSRRFPVSFVKPRSSIAEFTLWDGPGGSLFPTPEERGAGFDEIAHKQFREELVNALKSAEGVVLCLDSTDESRSLVMFESLPVIFGATGLADLPAKRICICLTKVDARFSDKGEGAQAAAENASALDCCHELLPRNNFGVLRNYCPKAHFAFAWTSVYGFLPSGAPNYDPAADKMARRHGDGQKGKAMDDWRPFRVLDPFVWLAGGHQRDLDVVSADQLY